MSLLIVESPSKCNIIQEYLKQYNVRCIATFGHFREIKSLDNISFSCDNVQVNYSVIPKHVKNVKKYSIILKFNAYALLKYITSYIKSTIKRHHF